MNGQLNSNIYNASNNEADIEELQKQIDSLNTSVGSISEKLDETTEALNEYKAENNNQISTAEIISTSATVDNLSSNTINGTTLCINGTSNQKDINAEDICATGAVHADRLYGSLIGGSINGSTLEVESGEVSGSLTAGTITAGNVNVTNSLEANTITSNSITNNGDATITGCLKAKGLELTDGSSLKGNAIDVCNVLAKSSICTMGNATIDGNLTVKGNITGVVNGNITSTNANITNATVDNLTVNNTLTVADGITLPNTLGDTTLTSVTTDKLTVNGDTELNGAVKAGSITIGDGSITAGEVCIGAKGIVIDKDKNGDFNNLSVNNMNANSIGVPGKIAADCIELLDSVVSKNVFAKNFYPENITIDKNVGDLHYSRQLDTDAVGSVLVDCKSVTPVEVTHSLFPKNGYIETETSAVETTYAKNKALKYSKRGNGLSVSSMVYRPDVCHSSYKTAVKFITGCSDPGITGCCGKGFTVENNGANGLSVSYFYDNCHCPFIDYNFCDTNKNTSTVISSCSLDVISKNINVKNISTCSVSDDNKVLKVDNCGNVYSGKITSSLIGNDCKCYNDCTLRFSCIYQNPSNSFYYYINNETAGQYRRNCQEMTCDNTKQCIIYCWYCQDNPYDNQGRCYCTFIDTYTNSTEKRKWCCDWNRNTNEQFECIIDEFETRNLGCPITNCVMFKKCCCNGNDPSKNTCVCYWDYTYNGLGGRYDSCGDYRGPQPSYFCRYTDGHPELGWRFSICDSNLYIANPQDGYKDILRVEDGKIYTKCGEFKAGGGVFDNSTATICDNFATYNLGHSVCTCKRTVKISTSITCAAENCCPITFSYGYDGQNPYIEATTGYDGTRIDLLRASIRYSHSNGDVVANVPTLYCSHRQEGNCTAYIECNTLNKVCSYDSCCYGHIERKGVVFDMPEWTKWCELRGNPVEIGCYYSRNGNEIKCLVYCVPVIGKKHSYLDYEDCISDCACYDVPRYIFNASYDFSNYKDCTWTENKLIETCTYTSKPVVLKYSKQQVDVCWECYYCPSCGNDQWQPKAYRCPQTDTCFYPVENGYRIDTTSSGCYQSKVTTNQIANLPITNTLVPLAGKVNGKGFAFFCKGSDGTKFYDGAFATVDAGSATDITYLVTTGV